MATSFLLTHRWPDARVRAMAQRPGARVSAVVCRAHHERPLRVVRLRGLPHVQRRVVKLRTRQRRAAGGATAVGSRSVATTASLAAQPATAGSTSAASSSARVVHAAGHVGVGTVWPGSDDTPDCRHREARAVATRRHAVARLRLSQGWCAVVRERCARDAAAGRAAAWPPRLHPSRGGRPRRRRSCGRCGRRQWRRLVLIRGRGCGRHRCDGEGCA